MPVLGFWLEREESYQQIRTTRTWVHDHTTFARVNLCEHSHVLTCVSIRTCVLSSATFRTGFLEGLNLNYIKLTNSGYYKINTRAIMQTISTLNVTGSVKFAILTLN